MVRRSALPQRVDDRLVDHAGECLCVVSRDPGHGRVAAHAAGVGTLVAFEDPLVVLRRRHRYRALTVAQREQGELLAHEELLEHDLRPAEAQLGEELLYGRARGGLVGADDHALAGGQRVGLEHGRIRRTRDVVERLTPRAKHRVRGGRHPELAHQLLRIALGALDPRGGGRGPEGTHAVRGQRVHHPGDQWHLRPHRHQVHLPVAGGPDDRVHVVDAHVEALDLVSGDPGVAGRAHHFRLLPAAQERAHQRVLAPPGADYEDARHVFLRGRR